MTGPRVLLVAALVIFVAPTAAIGTVALFDATSLGAATFGLLLLVGTVLAAIGYAWWLDDFVEERHREARKQ